MSKSEINDQSLWNNKNIEETIKRMDPDQLYRYQKMAQVLYDKANDPNPHTVNMEAATQISLMLRDGLPPDMLEENERQIYIDVYGQEELDKYLVEDEDLNNSGLKSFKNKTKDDDNRDNVKRFDSHKSENQGATANNERTERK
jgi:hypothetical protein